MLNAEDQVILYRAIRDGDCEMVKATLRLSVPNQSYEKANCRPFESLWHEPGPEATPLHLAVCCIQYEVASMLILHGADRSLKASGLTAFDMIEKYELFEPARVTNPTELERLKLLLQLNPIDVQNDCFGNDLLTKEFSHHNRQKTLRLNNGSFGACPRQVLQFQQAIRNRWIENPDDFWNLELFEGFLKASECIVENLLPAANPVDVVVVDNLTVAISIVIHSIIANIAEANSVVLFSSFTYNAVKEAIQHGCKLACEKCGNGELVCAVEVVLPFPTIDNASILCAYREALEKCKREAKVVAFGFLDHITSLPCVIMPINALVNLFREFEVKEILVDGAHTPCQVDIRGIPHLNIDYFVANLHKWCFAPTAVAFMWISPNAPSRKHLHHPIISHRYGQGLPAECAMLGTKDYSAMLSLPAAFTFVKSLGGMTAVYTRNADLCAAAAELLASAWKTREFLIPADTRFSMAMIGVPKCFGDTYRDGEKLRLRLRGEPFNIVTQKLVPVKGDGLYLRISAAVYNSINDYIELRDAVLQLAAEINGLNTGQH